MTTATTAATTSNTKTNNIVTDSTMSKANLDIVTKLNYEMKHGGQQRPWIYGRPRTRADPHQSDYGGDVVPTTVTIQNARNKNFDIDETSFELIPNVPTKLSTDDFYSKKSSSSSSSSSDDDDEKITSIYYKELEDIVCQKTGASKVVCFHHQVRNSDRMNGGSIQGYAEGIHSDSSSVAALQTHAYVLESLLIPDAETSVDDGDNDNDGEKVKQEIRSKFGRGRFVYFNIWRNIDEDHPISNNHLALLDERTTVRPDDYIESDFMGENDLRLIQYRLNVHNSHQHKWYYYPNMTKSEIVLFKQWDSDVTCPGRICFHSSFTDPKKQAATAPTRQSIEVRALAFFPDHTPNTFLTLDPLRTYGDKVLIAVKFIDKWPFFGQCWFYRTLASSTTTNSNEQQQKQQQQQQQQGANIILDQLVLDSWGTMGLKDQSDEVKCGVKDLIRNEFQDQAIQALATLKKHRLRVGSTSMIGRFLNWFFLGL